MNRLTAGLSVLALGFVLSGCLFGPEGEITSSIEEAVTETIVDEFENGSTDEATNGATDEATSRVSRHGELPPPPPNLPGEMETKDKETEKNDECEFTHSAHCTSTGVGGEIGHGTPQPHDPTPEASAAAEEADDD